ncbi:MULTISPECIES: hypothetical protein [unclassified Oceanispirochaeta]|uniref:hypothetical protein n=1 Tax=unclassified Oceanispirochaeta TaxID=2635722 RepID=UPI000E09ADE4|nr:MULTISPECIES: hypothetical protein [unclassified Oceanispirochaeta]MBF9019005.1 hypothetical protein [Oceanispirochaeta sp. M2]NPD75505.1 hypothetical protein [Oceanispirochaeta sp. M1]RDG28639.1 hypothetical protein DV872_25770 [Oceanispirochaeta sp. M1]
MKLILTCLGILVFASLFSCANGNTPADTTLPITVTIDGTEYAATGSYDFGLAEAKSTGITKTIILTNSTEFEITVKSITLSDEVNYSLITPTLPLTTAVDGTAEVKLTYSPQASGSQDSTISIEVDGLTDPYILNLTGEGNYAPTVKFGMKVSGAENSAANGFYDRDGFYSNYPNYTMAGNDYYMRFFDNDWFWGIGSTQGLDGPEYTTESKVTYMVPPESGWTVIPSVIPNGARLPLTPLTPLSDPSDLSITHYDISGTTGEIDDELTANYLYFDTEGDAEATTSTSYQWYRSDSEGETYTAITEATSKTYTPNNDFDSGHYLKVEITVTASTGITTESVIMSSATIRIQGPS